MTKIEALIDRPSTARKAKDFKEADRIRDELAAMGIQLKDAKDPATGETSRLGRSCGRGQAMSVTDHRHPNARPPFWKHRS